MLKAHQKGVKYKKDNREYDAKQLEISYLIKEVLVTTTKNSPIDFAQRLAICVKKSNEI
jgi:hypothetical protein